MATGFEQRKRNDLKGPEAEQKLDTQQKQDLERVEDGQELSADAAQRLAPQLGNQALAALLGRQGTNQDSGGAEQEEEVIEEVAEDKDLDQELEAPQMGGGGAAGGGGDPNAEGDPWDMGFLFGGEDDPDDPRSPTRQRRLRDSPYRKMDEEDPFAEGYEEEPREIEDHLAGITDRLGEIEPRPEEDRPGDTVYMTVETALLDPPALGRIHLDPEDLVATDGQTDPVGRPAEIGRFLAQSGASPSARALGRLLGEALAALIPAGGGYAGGVARLAHLAVCAEALEGGREATDRAVSLALSTHVWDEAVAAARPLAEEGRLHAAAVLEAALGGAMEEHSARAHLPEPSPLGAAALARLIPEGYIPEVPPLTFPAERPVEEGLPDEVAAIDALLFGFLGDGDGSPLPPEEAVVSPLHTEPMRHAARYLLNAVGRAQVEFAAAALAVTQIRPGTPVRATLVHADKALRQLARGIMGVVNTLEELPGSPIDEAEGTAGWAEGELNQARDGLFALRSWAFSTIAGAMDR